MDPAAGAAPSAPPPGSLPCPLPDVAPSMVIQPAAPASLLLEASSGSSASPSAPSGSMITPGQVSHDLSPLEQPLPDNEDDISDMTEVSSSGTAIHAEEANNLADDAEPFQTVQARKRRRGSKSVFKALEVHASTKNPLRHGLVVIVKPTDPSKIITRFNPLAVKDGLETIAPDGVLQVRPNHRLNLLAIDTRNADATERLLTISSIAEIPVRAYEPRPSKCGVGVIRGVAKDITPPEILEALRQRIPVKSVRRLGKSSESVQIVFATESTPEHVIIGYTRYRVYAYVETPRQCTKCLRFGHVSEVCQLPMRCTRCGGNHDRTTCNADSLRCANCGKKQEATSGSCSVRRDEQAIYKYKMVHNTDYKSAKAAVQEQRAIGPKKSSRGYRGSTYSYSYTPSGVSRGPFTSSESSTNVHDYEGADVNTSCPSNPCCAVF
ncbi:uncharacterized protein LOC144161825 [Haemaphysalis longicornis]